MNKQELTEKVAAARSSAQSELNRILSYRSKDTDYDRGRRNAYVEVETWIEDLEKVQKVTVPRFVADWFEKNKDDLDFAIYAAVAHSIKESDYYRYPEGFIEWIELADNKPIETIIRMKDGYDVEKEPVYEVVFLESDEERYLLMELGEKSYEVAPESENDGYRTQWFTESEIKSIDERYWAFAVPVEEDK